MEIKRWLPDRAGIAVMLAVLLFAILSLGFLPRWLNSREQADIGGAAVQTAPGTVATIQISPVSQGGGGLFNAVTVLFAGHQGYYALSPSSEWKPKRGQPVMVTYRQGRQSGFVHIDSVTPLP